MSGPFDALQEGERDPLLGALIDGRYRVKRLLGAGGMGRVYEAEHEGIRRGVALKVLHAQYSAAPDVSARFTREAWVPNSIASEHLVEVTDKGRLPDGAMFLVLEFLRMARPAPGHQARGALRHRPRRRSRRSSLTPSASRATRLNPHSPRSTRGNQWSR